MYARSWVLCIGLIVVGCNADDSDTTIVTTAITTTMGNVTATVPPPPGDDGGGVSETGIGEVSDGGDDTLIVSTSGMDGTGWGSGETDTSTEAGSETDTGETSGGVMMCDPSLLLAMTPGCVVGQDIASAAWGDQYCEATFGGGWIWLEHHQDWGWTIDGTWIDDNGIGERGWVYVNDQLSACYETNYGVTWVRPTDPALPCRAECWSTIGLEGPEYDPQDGQKCNSYTGDTPCEYCRPMICVRP